MKINLQIDLTTTVQAAIIPYIDNKQQTETGKMKKYTLTIWNEENDSMFTMETTASNKPDAITQGKGWVRVTNKEEGSKLHLHFVQEK